MALNEEYYDLYNKILNGFEDWDFSDLERLLELSNQETEKEMRQKAIEAFKFATDGYFIIGGTDYSENRLNEFIEKLNS